MVVAQKKGKRNPFFAGSQRSASSFLSILFFGVLLQLSQPFRSSLLLAASAQHKPSPMLKELCQSNSLNVSWMGLWNLTKREPTFRVLAYIYIFNPNMLLKTQKMYF
jgi:hypothetical protein